MTEHPVEVVVWLDAWFSSEPSEPDDWEEEWRMTTTGFVVRETKTLLSLAHELLPEGDYKGVSHIPKSLVVSRTRLVPSRRR